MEGTTEVMQSSNTKTCFSEGVCVLVVDHDSTCLRITERMLDSCKYKVVAVQNAVEALDIVHDSRDEFDIALVELHWPPVNFSGLELLKSFRNEFKHPVIMMSSDEDHKAAEKCLQQGAAYYFTKPLSMKIFQNLWQFVFSDKSAKMKELDQMKGKECAPQESSSSVIEGEIDLPDLKRKLDWTGKLHLKFLEAIAKIGLENTTPTKIHEAMNEPGLTRLQVASHLQKYRNYVRSQMQDMNGFHHPTSSLPYFWHKYEHGSCSNQAQQCLNYAGVQQNLSLGESLPKSSDDSIEIIEIDDTCSTETSYGNNVEEDPIEIIEIDNESNTDTLHGGNNVEEDPIEMIEIDNASNIETLHGNNVEEVQSIGLVGSVGDFNITPNFNSIDNNYVGFQINDFGMQLGLNETDISPSNDTNYGYNLMDELLRTCTTTEEDMVQQHPLVPPPPPPTPPAVEKENIFRDVPMIEEGSFLQAFDDSDLFDGLDPFL